MNFRTGFQTNTVAFWMLDGTEGWYFMTASGIKHLGLSEDNIRIT